MSSSQVMKRLKKASKLRNRALKLKDEGKIFKAIDLLEKGMKIDPDNIDIMRNLGDFYTLTGENGAAGKWYAKILRFDPYDADAQAALVNLGIYEIYKPDTRIIETDVIEPLRSTLENMFELGENQNGSTNQVQPDSVQGVSEPQGFSGVPGQLHHLQTRIRASLTNPKSPPHDYKREVEYLLDRAKNFEKQGDFLRAREMLERILRSNKNNAEIWMRLGFTYAKLSRFGEALYCIVQAYKLKRTPDKMVMILALRKLDFPRNPFKETPPTYAEKMYEVGVRYCIQRNDLTKGIYFIKRALEVDPRYEKAWFVQELRKSRTKLLENLVTA